MKKLFLASTFLAISAMSAQAADLPRKSAPVYKPVVSVPSFVWTGFYAGINGGYLRQHVAGNIIGGRSTSGGIIGGTIGYNYQLQNNIVLGLEGDLGYVSNSRTSVLNAVPLVTGKVSNNYLGTVRARVGYSLGMFMPYITGGFAFQDTKLSYANSAFPLSNFSKSSNSAGYAVGGGVEAQIYQNFTAKVEYLYVDFGKQNYAGYGKVRLNDHVIRAGLNYKFNL